MLIDRWAEAPGFRSVRGAGAVERPVLLALPLGIVALAVGPWSESAAALLQLDRDLLRTGELWRLATCHLAHFGPGHAVRDAGLLTLVIAAVWRDVRRREALAGALAMAGLLVPLAVLVLEPGLERYRGASGLGAAALAVLVGTTRGFDHRFRRAAVGILAVLVAAEAISGRSIVANGLEIRVATSAHLGGLAAGLIVLLDPRSGRGPR